MSSNMTRISCAELERMQESITAADAYQIKSSEEIARLRTLEQARQRELARICQENQRLMERSVEALTSSYRAAAAGMDRQARARLAGQSHTFAGQLEQLRAQAAQAGSRAAALTGAVDKAARTYSEMLESVLAEQSRGEGRAKKTLEEVDVLLERIRALHPSAFLPAAYASLEAMRASISANLASGDLQAAMIVSQDSILEASRVLIQLVVLNEQHSTYAGQLRERTAALQAKAERISSGGGTLAFELEGEQAELPYDIRFWSYGAFDGLDRQINVLHEHLQKDADAPIGQEQLQKLEEQLVRLEKQLHVCDQEARKNLAGAVAVENTAQRLYGSLHERGWALESSGRQGGDSRKPYSMTYTDGAGNTVSIVIASGERPESPSFIYEAFSDSESMAALIKKDVGAALKEEGLSSDFMEERDDCAPSPDVFISRAEREAAQLSARRQERLRRSLYA